MDSEQFEIRGRVIAQAYWDEMEKIAYFAKGVLQKAAPEALADAWQYASHAPAQAGLGWRRFIPGTRTRAAHLAEKSRAGAVKGEVASQLSQKENAALEALANPSLDQAGRTSAQANLAAIRRARGRVGLFKKEPIAPSIDDVNTSLAGGKTVPEQEASRSKFRTAGLVGAGTLAAGGGLYGYHKLTQPAAPDYPQY